MGNAIPVVYIVDTIGIHSDSTLQKILIKYERKDYIVALLANFNGIHNDSYELFSRLTMALDEEIGLFLNSERNKAKNLFQKEILDFAALPKFQLNFLPKCFITKNIHKTKEKKRLEHLKVCSECSIAFEQYNKWFLELYDDPVLSPQLEFYDNYSMIYIDKFESTPQYIKKRLLAIDDYERFLKDMIIEVFHYFKENYISCTFLIDEYLEKQMVSLKTDLDNGMTIKDIFEFINQNRQK